MPTGLDRVVQGIFKDGAMQDAKRKLLDCTLANGLAVRGCRVGARRGVCFNRNGFTLIELLVYIGIVGIIVIVAGQAYSNSTKMRVRTQSMLKASEEVENIAALMKEDLAQMGTKSAMNTANEFSAVYNDVYMDSVVDKSSFKLNSESDLSFRRVRYNDNGAFVSVEEVRWWLEGKTLRRSCRTVATEATIAADDPCSATDAAGAIQKAVIIAENVDSLAFVMAKPSVTEDAVQLFPPANGDEFMLLQRVDEPAHYHMMNVENNDNISTLSGFAYNYEDNAATNVNSPETAERNQVYVAENNSDILPWNTACTKKKNKFTLKPHVVYELSFSLPYTGADNQADPVQMFAPGRDHMSIGFRNSDGTIPAGWNDFLFYPSVSSNASEKRTMRFSVANTIEDVCLAFTFVNYLSAIHDGKIKIKSLKFKQLATANNTFENWSPESNITQKKNVKAMKFILKTSRNGESGRVETFVALPSNGPED